MLYRLKIQEQIAKDNQLFGKKGCTLVQTQTESVRTRESRQIGGERPD